MTISRPCYASRNDVKQALDIRSTAYRDAQIDRALESASGAAEGVCSRPNFYPLAATRKWDWPNWQHAGSWRLWLEEWEAVSISSLTPGGVTLTQNTHFLLRPAEGPPYDRIEILLSGSRSFGAGSTWQESVVAVGVWGWDDTTSPAGTLAEDLDNSETGVDLGACPDLSAGDLITIGTEKMLVTGATLLDTGQTIGADLAASKAADSVAVTTGSAYSAGETVTIGSERMRVLDVAGNALIVERGSDGSVLAAHTTGDKVYAPRTLTVVRGAVGTTKATHLTNAVASKQVYPPILRDLVIAETINRLEQETSAYARTVGSGDNVRNASGAGLADLRRQAERDLGRQARIEVV